MSDFYIKIIVGLVILCVCLIGLLGYYYCQPKPKPQILVPKNVQDYIILEILEYQPKLELYRSDVFSGGVTFKYNGNVIRVTYGIDYCVEVGRHIVDDKIAEVFYHYLSDTYACFFSNSGISIKQPS